MIRQTTIRVIFPPLICRQTQKKDAAEVKSGKTKFDQIEWVRLKKCGEDEIRTNWTDEVETIASEVEAEKIQSSWMGGWKNAEKTKFDQIEWTWLKNDCIGEKCEDQIEPTRRGWKNAEKMKYVIRLSNNSFSIKLIFEK